MAVDRGELRKDRGEKKGRKIRRTKETKDDLSKDRITPGGGVTRATKCSTLVRNVSVRSSTDGTPVVVEGGRGMSYVGIVATLLKS